MARFWASNCEWFWCESDSVLQPVKAVPQQNRCLKSAEQMGELFCEFEKENKFQQVCTVYITKDEELNRSGLRKRDSAHRTKQHN